MKRNFALLIPVFLVLLVTTGFNPGYSLFKSTTTDITAAAIVAPVEIAANLLEMGAQVNVCDQGAFVADITIPDGKYFTPGTPFVKTWRIMNAGTCTWTTAYQFVFTSGDRLSGPAAINLPGSVAPGQIIDISVSLLAPYNPGTYQGYWKLKNPSGNIFGFGVNGDLPIYVLINDSSPYGQPYGPLVNQVPVINPIPVGGYYMPGVNPVPVVNPIPVYPPPSIYQPIPLYQPMSPYQTIPYPMWPQAGYWHGPTNYNWVPYSYPQPPDIPITPELKAKAFADWQRKYCSYYQNKDVKPNSPTYTRYCANWPN